MTEMARRDFLKSAGTAAVPVAFVRRASGSVNDRVRVAVIGLGGRGRDHMRSLSRIEGVEVATFCDPDEQRMSEKASEFAEKTGKKPALEPDLRRVLDDRSIDAITIATCNHWHALASIWACQAGKHVYVEKPVAHDLVEGRMMVEAARKHNRIVQGGTQRRSSETIQKAVRALHDGIIGDIYMARCIHFQRRESIGFKQPEPPPAHLHWDLWLGPAPEQPFHRNLVHYNWHWFWDFGNGELGNNGIHYIDVARWGLNKELPVKIVSTGGRYGYKDQGQTPNTQLATYEFDDGTELVCEIRGRFSNGEDQLHSGIFFYGSKGYMAVSPGSARPVKVFLGGSKEPEPATGGLEGAGPSRSEEIGHFANFFDAIRSGKREVLTAEINETYLSTAFCLLGNIAFRLGRTLSFDPQKQRFVADNEADRMLTRTYRKPFNLPDKV